MWYDNRQGQNLTCLFFDLFIQTRLEGEQHAMQELQYPFDSEYLLKKSKKIRRQLLEGNNNFLHKKIAVLGGSTTHDIIRMLELFLLDQGIQAEFYESEYGQYWQDAMFENPELDHFEPDLIFVHTSNRNITAYPAPGDPEEKIEAMLGEQYAHFETMWDKLEQTFHCPIVQNNFEYPFYRILGNQDAADIHGRIHFINHLNGKFYEYAGKHESFYINDMNYAAAAYGLDKWADPFYWHMYKYAMCMQAIPSFAFNVSNIIKAIFGKNKKSLVLDLEEGILPDNTGRFLWQVSELESCWEKLPVFGESGKAPVLRASVDEFVQLLFPGGEPAVSAALLERMEPEVQEVWGKLSVYTNVFLNEIV